MPTWLGARNPDGHSPRVLKLGDAVQKGFVVALYHKGVFKGGYGFKPQNKCITIINSSKFKTHYHIQWKPKQTVKKPNNSLLYPCYIVIIIIIVAVSIINKGKDVGKVLELQDMH